MSFVYELWGKHYHLNDQHPILPIKLINCKRDERKVISLIWATRLITASSNRLKLTVKYVNEPNEKKPVNRTDKTVPIPMIFRIYACESSKSLKNSLRLFFTSFLSFVNVIYWENFHWVKVAKSFAGAPKTVFQICKSPFTALMLNIFTSTVKKGKKVISNKK